MDNLGNGSLGNQNLNKPIPFDNDPEKPIPLDDLDTPVQKTSHSPLDLGGSHPAGMQKVPKPAAQPKPVVAKAASSMSGDVSSGRITGIRTFFTKLHVGALSFLDDQIMDWLKSNPNIVVKQTNVCVGEVQGKKTEPNIVITIWY